MKKNDIIYFHEPFLDGNEILNVNKAINEKSFAGDGKYTKIVEKKIENFTRTNKCLLTPSGTAALEMAALSLKLSSNDEILISSFTFVSTASAFALRGCKIKFIDISGKTLQFDFNKIKQMTNKKTKAIVIVHYGGTSSGKIEELVSFCKERKIPLIEDAAQSIGVRINGKHLGTFGDLGCLSFHSTKNIHCGEGGALLINNKSLIKECEMVRQKGTNRSDFDKKLVDKYTWKTLGSSYLMSDFNAAFLEIQLDNIDNVNKHRIKVWKQYSTNLLDNVFFRKQVIDQESYFGNGHIYFIIFNNKKYLNQFYQFMSEAKIQVYAHYTSLHDKQKVYKNIIKTNCNECDQANDLCVRLPIHSNLTIENVKYIINKINEFVS
jgi:dTDP-4-amino-4,6-dideoxygalactose transaminase